MKKLLTTALLALTAARDGRSAEPRRSLHLPERGPRGLKRACTVYLPDGYDRSQESYPVLYLLHGASRLPRPTGHRKATCAASPTKPSPQAWPDR